MSDIIYIYTLEPTSFRRAQTGKLIQKTAGNLANRMLLNTTLKRAAASNILFLVSALVIGGGLYYAINWYKERKKVVALSQKGKNKNALHRLEKPAMPLSEVFIEKFPYVHGTGHDNQLQDTYQKGNVEALLDNQYTR